MTRQKERIIIGLWSLAIVLLSYWMGQQAYGWMPPQATVEAQHVDTLFSFLVGLGTLVFLGVVSMILYAIATCRAPKGDYREGHTTRGNNTLEVIWTVIPAVLVMWIAFQNYKIYQLLDIHGLSQFARHPSHEQLYASSSSRLAQIEPVHAIEVTAQQWKWSFRYPEANLTSPELHMPVNQQVKLVLKSEDVIHGFYIPEFRVKQDIVPGHELDITVRPLIEGIYKLRNSQFSGTYFALMEADVYLEKPQDYRNWLALAKQQPAIVTSNAALEEYHRPPHHLIGDRWPALAPATEGMDYPS